MLDTEMAAQIAQRRVSRALWTSPAKSTATLPFDPRDAEDVCHWARRELVTRERLNGATTPAYAATRLALDARKMAARAGKRADAAAAFRARVPSCYRTDHGQREPLTPRTRGVFDDEEMSEVLAVAAARASARMQISCRTGEPTSRLASAALSCLLRLMHGVRRSFEERAAGVFITALFEQPAFRGLHVSSHQRKAFVTTIQRLGIIDNTRCAIRAAGGSPPSSTRWREFQELLADELQYDDEGDLAIDRRKEQPLWQAA